MRLLSVTVPLTLLALGAGATSAAAEDFCVQKPSCIGTAVTAAQLQARLIAAQSNGQADRFFLGATTFANGPYAYQSEEPLELIGATGGGSVLQSGVVGRTVLTLVGGAASVTGVNVEIALDASSGVSLSRATARDVAVSQLLGTNAGVGVFVDDGATLADASVAMRTPTVPGVGSINGDATIVDTMIASQYAALLATSTTGVMTVRRSTLSAPIGGLALGGRLSVSDTLADGRSGTAGTTSIGFAALAQGGKSVALDVARSTIVGWSTASRSALGAYAVAEAGGTATVDIADTAIAGAGIPVLRSADPTGLATIALQRTARGEPIDRFEGGPGAITEIDRLAAPDFVDADGGDFRLPAGSPLIDAGDPDAGAALAGALDLAGAARVVDGNGDCVARVDVGAYEYQPPAACPVTPVDGGGTPVPAPPTVPAPQPQPRPTPQPRRDRVKPVLSALHVPARITRTALLPRLGAARRAPAIAFRLSEAARVTVAFARRRGARFTPLKPTLTVSARAGASRLRFGGRITRRAKLAPGSYRVTLAARDAAGNRSRAVTATLRIV